MASDTPTNTRMLFVLMFLVSGMVLVPLVVLKRPHWVPLLWRVPYTTGEVGGTGISPDALARLQQVRESTRRRYRISSGYRSRSRNTAVGGASGSQHIAGIAFDVRVPHSHRERFYDAARDAGFTGYGWGNGTVHIDLGRRRWWTYNDAGKAMRGAEAYRFLHKAPANFLDEFGLTPSP